MRAIGWFICWKPALRFSKSMAGKSEHYLISFLVDRLRLMMIAAVRRTVPPSGDLGYVIHQVLKETFGSAAPKPFHIFDTEELRVVAYSPHSGEDLVNFALRQRDIVPGWELAAKVLNFPAIEAFPVPRQWKSGQQFRFAVRTRPVTRISHARERGLPREYDVFLHAISSKPEGEKEWLEREPVYLSWFKRQVPEDAAKITACRVFSTSLTDVHRKGASAVSGPDVTFMGALEVRNAELFVGFLARGIGRHRAFGFGMLLLVKTNPKEHVVEAETRFSHKTGDYELLVSPE